MHQAKELPVRDSLKLSEACVLAWTMQVLTITLIPGLVTLLGEGNRERGARPVAIAVSL